MPGLNGFQLAVEIKKMRQDIPILFMMAFVIDEKMPGYPSALRKEKILQKPGDILGYAGNYCLSLHGAMLNN